MPRCSHWTGAWREWLFRARPYHVSAMTFEPPVAREAADALSRSGG